MKQTIPYVFVVFIAVVWLWFSKFVSFFGPNLGEALGYNLVSVGLPVLLLWFAARGLYRGLKKQGAIAPYKLTFGSISCSCALISIFDVFSLADPHRVGAVIGSITFGIAAIAFLGFAYKQQHGVNKAGEVAMTTREGEL